MQRVGRRRLVMGQATLDQYRHALADEAMHRGRAPGRAPMSSSINRQASARSAMVSSSVPSRSKVTDGNAGHQTGQFGAQRADDRVVADAGRCPAGAIDAEPATKVSTPARAISAMLAVFTPPSISRRMRRPVSALVGVELGAGLPGLGQRAGDELWPPKPGLTLISRMTSILSMT